MLLLTKDTGLRDQLAATLGGDPRDDIESEVAKYHIASTAPRVRVVEEYTDLFQREQVEQADIWVSTVAMFFTQAGEPKTDLARILAQFGVIVFDEMHYAYQQVRKLVDTAYQSLCFGLTGTPIDAGGAVLEPLVLLGLYDYEDAVRYDHSLKHLCADLDEHVIVEKIVYGDVRDARGERRIGSPDDMPDYAENFAAAKTVAERTIRLLLEDDEVTSTEPAIHRTGDLDVSLCYPVHALLQVPNRDFGYQLKEAIGQFLDQHRDVYPAERGFRVELVATGDDKQTTTGRRPYRRLDRRHPWLATWRNGGVLAPNAARILIAVDMVREGTNNPPCAIVALCGRTESVIDLVQRAIGRPIRSVDALDLNGRLRVPPAALDRVTIVTHETFETLGPLSRAINFVLDMRGHFEHLRTVADLLVEPTLQQPREKQPRARLTTAERIQLAGAVGQARARGEEPEIESITCGFDDSEQRKAAWEWVEQVRDRPLQAAANLGYLEPLAQIGVVLHERAGARADHGRAAAFSERP